MEPQCTLVGHAGIVSAVRIHDDLIVSGGIDQTIRVWNRLTGEPVSVLHGHEGEIECIQFDGETVVSGSGDRTIRVAPPVDVILTLRFDRFGPLSINGAMQSCVDTMTASHAFNSTPIASLVVQVTPPWVYGASFNLDQLLICALQGHSNGKEDSDFTRPRRARFLNTVQERYDCERVGRC